MHFSTVRMSSRTGSELFNSPPSRTPLYSAAAGQILAVLLACIFLAYFALIGAGQWQADEYADFGELARSGWHILLPRLKWSPRPFSEVLFFLYGALVNHLRQPLIIPFLGLLWIGLLVAALLTWWKRRRREHRENGWPDLLLGLALLASFVTGGPLLEMFYWPAGAVAYLPTLSATVLLFLQVVAGRLETPKGRAVCGVCLLIAASSTEAGATFVASYAAVQLIASTLVTRTTRDGCRRWIWWLLPAIVAVAVLIVLRLNRYESSEPIFGLVPNFARSSGAIVIASLRQGLLEIADTPNHYHAWFGIPARVISRCLLALGAGVIWRFSRRMSTTIRWQILGVVVAFLAAALATISAAELHFGAECCARHETLRRCWFMMSFAGIGMVLSSWPTPTRFAEGRRQFALSLGSLLLCAGAVTGWRARELLRTYRIYRPLHSMVEQNFRSGFDRSSSTMDFFPPPGRGLIVGAQVDPGTYTLATLHESNAQEYYLRFILAYFDKRTIHVHRTDAWLDNPHR